VLDRLRPEGHRDPYGVEQAKQTLAQTYAYLDTQIVGPWALGEMFTMADCAAAPALFYADHVVPLTPTLRGYLDRLKQRPSFARVIEEARPYFKNFPLGGLS
jgi:glutathione S-transferase